MIKNELLSDTMYELKIRPEFPWEVVQDVEIIALMAELYDHQCPWELMEKVMDEYVKTDEALVFCGSLEVCQKGQKLLVGTGLVGEVSEVK